MISSALKLFLDGRRLLNKNADISNQSIYQLCALTKNLAPYVRHQHVQRCLHLQLDVFMYFAELQRFQDDTRVISKLEQILIFFSCIIFSIKNVHRTSNGMQNPSIPL